MRDGTSWFSEYRIRRPDSGEIAWLEEGGTALMDGSGRVGRCVGVLANITSRKEGEEELRQRNEELERANRELEVFSEMNANSRGFFKISYRTRLNTAAREFRHGLKSRH